MTWTESTTTGVKCDERDHIGDPNMKVIHGVAVSALAALKAKGWHYDARTQRHQCADCRALARVRAGRR